jgi:hypothetical protein
MMRGCLAFIPERCDDEFFMLFLRHHNEKNSWLQFTSAIYVIPLLYWSKIANTYRRI